MTKREFFTAIANSTSIDSELVEFATSTLEKMDASDIARKNKPSKRKIENAPLVETIMSELITEGKSVTASEIAESLGITTQKASAILRGLVSEGKLISGEIKVSGKPTCKCYSLGE